ncbi:lysM and putative peptidoglycan-binding domain-containing protein 1-like isoform X2 [Mya arenaria]|uniref:lysM and putative peptidoglycan-binding domain-containing protein 1-like isoform X2 n=1 Tax=Mya arenaria TaxID=6604 RepID=UPI0022E301A4|nr:lysM and putative peptidoglycan-binding domain-containing protein 1-like isoform X2 [Mya arenaria]
MADEGAERRFFGEIVRNANTYGSTTKPRPKYAKFAKHDISRLDTLQGIALKYGATVEQIKRENKLWTNDSLFLREYLYIPITNENTHLIKDDWELLSSDEVRSRSNSELLNSNEDLGARGSDKTEPNVNVGESVNSAKSETAGMDFFSKYDSSIAALKSKVDKLEQNSSPAPSSPMTRLLDLESPYQITEKETAC